ncbi:SacI domain and endonuclease/exonuclease/phosphatase family protein [Aspergillus saccharolyticus JOP 1030-1]|uniref:phosphoinositide 5-phosphatase n=1 Tax=Aspergillus saccharolyticus JOP 1030-1 TaxID=1450539 RepID=A0A318ZTH2_9EURO|nr:SacI domain and endonuclease/exonuclease/phosphatase family protein [Aspergillus saccharolyticus JOP 1030-1]PYH47280.1 SacI domain and endonuclease/exonuclease/phosphatase family protein [Aspergillus saccharolyticus JOP 1030-1]
MASLQIYTRNYPQCTVALVTPDHTLIFQSETRDKQHSDSETTPHCLVELVPTSTIELEEYQLWGHGYGTLGLIHLAEAVFVSVITGSHKAATVRPGESVFRIDTVDFFCLSQSKYEDGLYRDVDLPIPSGSALVETYYESRDTAIDAPFLSLKKLLSDGSFYYSVDFNLTDRLQDRSDKLTTFDVESFDEDMLWNAYLINPLLVFRKHLAPSEKKHLDSSRILTCVIRGFCSTLTIPSSAQITSRAHARLPSLLTIISRQSSRRAGTRFNSRGIDDDGHVANFVETETILWVAPHITFSYVQLRGSVPAFWEQASGFLPGQQKIELTRSVEASQHAFHKHFKHLELKYGAIHVINLLSDLRPGEVELSKRFRELIRRESISQEAFGTPTDHSLLQLTEFDLHAETRGPTGYGASNQIRPEIFNSLQGFAYFQAGEPNLIVEDRQSSMGSTVILQQEGAFRTNCLDCLDRTNLVQTLISSMALDAFFHQQGSILGEDVKLRHSTLWADNGDALSKIYAGTGALKSSFTRHGKMSIAGALADARKSAARIYVNNFSDKARQQTIDILLGRLTGQTPVHLFDPVNDRVAEELDRLSSEFLSTKAIKIWSGTFNLNGRHPGPKIDLRPWLLSCFDHEGDDTQIVAIGFQEIVTLSPQQIMSTDPTTRKVWEQTVQSCLNSEASSRKTPKYVLLRSGQLVGAALMVFVREDSLKFIKNVEGSVKKTGLSGMAGNKGGCAIRFDYSNTRICFVTAHLAAGFANYDERNKDHDTILRGLRFLKNRTIEDHDTIVWLGDFNYRIGLSNQLVRELALQGDYQKLYDNDQLNLQMLAGRAFHFYTEGPITFPPTYKYDIGTDLYDTSEKARIPAWCDRVLWKGSNLRQIQYDTANLQFSDHRPVWAMFTCIISVVNDDQLVKLRHKLYSKYKHTTRVMVASEKMRTKNHNRTLYPPEKAPGTQYSATSTAFDKWWLSHGNPVRSQVTPPATNHIWNIHRSSNPFSEDDIDWIQLSPCDTVKSEEKKPALPPRVNTPVNQGYTAFHNLRHNHFDPSVELPGESHQERHERLKTTQPLSQILDHKHINLLTPADTTMGQAGQDPPILRRSRTNQTVPDTVSSDKNCDLLSESISDRLTWKALDPQ